MKNSNHMKKYTSVLRKLSLIMLVFASTLFLTNLFGQKSDFKIEILPKNETSTNSKDGELKIIVQGNAQSYSYSLFDKEPWNQGSIIKYTEFIDQTEYTFLNLAPGNYFVCVTDSEDKSVCESINLSEDQK
jgi:hypothetical protein